MLTHVSRLQDGNTALMLAAANGHAVVAAMLSSVPDQAMNTTNAVRSACTDRPGIRAKPLTAVVCGLWLQDGFNAIMLAGKNGHAEVIRALMESDRLDADAPDKLRTLHMAVAGRHAAAVHALTTFGVDVNRVTSVRGP